MLSRRSRCWSWCATTAIASPRPSRQKTSWSSTRTRSLERAGRSSRRSTAIPGFDGDVLVLSGDVPLLEADTLAALIDAHRQSGAAATVLSALLSDGTGYGRVIRDAEGSVERIVEQKDATADEASVTEINAGVYVFRAPALRAQLAFVGTANAQGEKYLTDVVALLRAARELVAAAAAPDAAAALGVNDRVQLAEAGRLLNARTVRRWQLEGATIIDPATTWIDVDAVARARCHGAAEHAASRRDGDRDRRDDRPRLHASPTARSARARRSPVPRPRSPSSAQARPSAPSRTSARERTSAPAARSARSSRRRTPRSAKAARCLTCRTSATPRSEPE